MDVDRGVMNGGRGPGPPDGRLRRVASWVRGLASALGRRTPFAPSGAVGFEQAVYGSFAFRDQGYAVLARSPGCRDAWVADFRAACQKLGERPAGVAEAAGLFALRLPSGPWAVVGVSPQGCDDRGRPGALAFHGLFLSPAGYRKLGRDPFALAGALRSDWSAETRSLPPGSWPAGRVEECPGAPIDPRAGRVVAALTRGRRVVLEAPGPVDALAREVWRALPARVRARASVATWAFGNDNRFDLLAVPRLAGVALDASNLDPQPPEAGTDPAAGESDLPGRRFVRVSSRTLAGAGAAVFLAAAGVGLALRGDGDHDDPGVTPDRPTAPAPAPSSPAPAVVAPALAAPDDHDDPGERRRVAEALADLAARFGVGPAGVPDPDPVALMETVARDLRYRGPFLSPRELAELRPAPGPDAASALRWDALARRFADDRPLPADFRRRALRGQLAALVWSFHGEAEWAHAEGPRRAASEVAQALAESLTPDESLRPSPLAGRYPALASYRAFLGRLPRR